MPTFETPEPIAVTLELPNGNVRLVASDRTDTVVEVHAEDDCDPGAVEAAATTRVEFRNGRLLIKAPPQRSRGWRWAATLFGGGTPVEVTVALPSGSRVQGETAFGEFHAEGRLGDCRLRSTYGEIRLDHVGSADLATSNGDIDVDRVEGPAEVATSSGEVGIRVIDGPAVIKNDHGEIAVGRVTGDLRMIGSHGDMTVDRATADVEARSAYGSVRIGEVVRGVTTLTSTYGDLEIGVRDGTAAWLDVQSATGELRNLLRPRSDPEGCAETVEIRARTRDGDIVVRRS